MYLPILYINDVHGHLEPHPELFYRGDSEVIATAGGYARIASYIRSVRRTYPHALVFDGGDTLHGTLPVVHSQGEALVPILRAMGISAMVAHWDFAYGPPQLQTLASQLGYPVLGINVFRDDGSLLLPPYIMLTVKGMKIGVVGICCNIIADMPGSFAEGIRVTDGTEELPGAVEQVRKAGADIVLLLSHNGFPQDAHMVSRVDGIDLCLSAHTHDRLYEPVVVNGTPIVQCGCHGSFVGHLGLDIQDGRVTLADYQLVTMDDAIEPDPEVAALVTDTMRPYQAMKDAIVGTTSRILHRYDTLNSSMDALLLAAVRSATDARIAFSNGWRYGAPVDVGSISRWDLFNMVPMDPPVSTVELEGREISQMLEGNLERTFSADPMSQRGGYVKRCLGITVKMRAENPCGHRIQEIYVGDTRLDHDAYYPVAFITAQGVPEGIGRARRILNISAVEAMEAYLRDTGSIPDEMVDVFALV